MHSRRTAVALSAVSLLALAACGSSSSTKTASISTTGPAATTAAATDTASAASSATGATTGSAAAEVPAAIKAKGTIIVAADASYAPNEFIDTDGKTVIGMDADLAKAIGTELGLKVTIVNETFDGIIPGLSAGRYDLGMSSFTDTKAREAMVDFVDYFSAGTSFFTKAGAPTVTGLSGLCGLAVSVEKGTTEQTDAEGASKTCTAAGKKAVTVLVFNDQNGANLALSSGRATVSMADSPVAAYQVKQSDGAFVLSGEPYGTAPYGIAIPKGNGMAQPVEDAIKDLIANGQYTSILTKWGVQAGAITAPAINGATS